MRPVIDRVRREVSLTLPNGGTRTAGLLPRAGDLQRLGGPLHFFGQWLTPGPWPHGQIAEALADKSKSRWLRAPDLNLLTGLTPRGLLHALYSDVEARLRTLVGQMVAEHTSKIMDVDIPPLPRSHGPSQRSR